MRPPWTRNRSQSRTTALPCCATARIDAAGLSDRMQAVPCDFFTAVPQGGDTYLMKHIIHDWQDEQSIIILKNIAAAMGSFSGPAP